MGRTTLAPDLGHRLLQIGVALLFLGLLTGFAIPLVENPRMGLASHLEGVLNGMLLILLGLVWPRLRLGRRTRGALFGLALYGTAANWLATLLAAAWDAGAAMPLAQGRSGTAAQEAVVNVLLWTLSVSMLLACALVSVGLRPPREVRPQSTLPPCPSETWRGLSGRAASR